MISDKAAGTMVVRGGQGGACFPSSGGPKVFFGHMGMFPWRLHDVRFCVECGGNDAAFLFAQGVQPPGNRLASGQSGVAATLCHRIPYMTGTAIANTHRTGSIPLPYPPRIRKGCSPGVFMTSAFVWSAAATTPLSFLHRGYNLRATALPPAKAVSPLRSATAFHT